MNKTRQLYVSLKQNSITAFEYKKHLIPNTDIYTWKQSSRVYPKLTQSSMDRLEKLSYSDDIQVTLSLGLVVFSRRNNG